MNKKQNVGNLVYCMVLIFTFIFMTFGRHLLDRR